MAQVLRRKKHGIEIQLLQIFAGQFLQRPAKIWKRRQALIAAAGIRWQIASAMRRADFQLRKKVQRSIFDQVRERQRGFQGVSDDMIQESVSRQSFSVDVLA